MVEFGIDGGTAERAKPWKVELIAFGLDLGRKEVEISRAGRSSRWNYTG